MNLSDWGNILTREECEAMMESGYTLEKYEGDEVGRDEVLEVILKHYGGLTSVSQVKEIIRRVYFVDL